MFVEDVHVGAPVGSRVFVPEPDHVTELVDHDAELVAVLADGDRLRSAAALSHERTASAPCTAQCASCNHRSINQSINQSHPIDQLEWHQWCNFKILPPAENPYGPAEATSFVKLCLLFLLRFYQFVYYSKGLHWPFVPLALRSLRGR